MIDHYYPVCYQQVISYYEEEEGYEEECDWWWKEDLLEVYDNEKTSLQQRWEQNELQERQAENDVVAAFLADQETKYHHI